MDITARQAVLKMFARKKYMNTNQDQIVMLIMKNVLRVLMALVEVVVLL